MQLLLVNIWIGGVEKGWVNETNGIAFCNAQTLIPWNGDNDNV